MVGDGTGRRTACLGTEWRGLDAEGKEQGPEAVMSHICYAPSSEIVPAPEDAICVVGMIGAVRHRAKPETPVKTFRHRHCLSRVRGPLRPYGSVRPVVNFPEISNGTVADHFFHDIIASNLAIGQE